MARFNLQTLTPQAWMNMIVQYVWDSQPIGSVLSANPLPFFQSNVQTAVTNVAKTLVDTNMPQSGFFPSPDSYYVTGFMCLPLSRSPGAATFLLTDLTDQTRVLDQGIFSFFVGSNSSKIVEGHLMTFPCGLGQQGMVTTGGATGSNVAYITGNGVRMISNAYNLTDQFAEQIGPGEKVAGQVSFPAGVVGASLVTTTFTLRCILRGLWNQAVR